MRAPRRRPSLIFCGLQGAVDAILGRTRSNAADAAMQLYSVHGIPPEGTDGTSVEPANYTLEAARGSFGAITLA